MNFDKNDLIKILDSNTNKKWSEEMVSDEMVVDFNTQYATFSKLYPAYDPYDASDYNGKEDDDFLNMLGDVVSKEGQELFESVNNLTGKSLVDKDGWPVDYNEKTFVGEECEKALDEAFASESWNVTKATMSKYPSKITKSALAKNRGWNQFKIDSKSELTKLAAFCLGPDLDGRVECWNGMDVNPFVSIKNLIIKDLQNHQEVTGSIMEALLKKHPMTPAIKSSMKNQVIPNLHLRVINESSLELDAEEFADIASALNATAQNLADIVHGFVSKAITKAKEMAGKGEGAAAGSDDNTATDANQEIVKCYQECVAGGATPQDAIKKCAEKFSVSEAEILDTLTAMNIAVTSAASNNAASSANGPAASSQPNAATEKPVEETKLFVNKQYQTASGQVMTLRKMTGGPNPSLIFEDDNTGEKVELLQDKFMKMNPVEANIDATKTRKSLINKFKKRINLSAMKTTAKIIYKTKKGHKIYEALDSIKSNGKAVGDIAGVVIGSGSGGSNQVEYAAGDSVKAGDIEGEIQSFKMNEADEPEIIVKTPDGDEVTITVADFEESEPVHMDLETELEEDPNQVMEHVEYKGYSLLENEEDGTWCVMQGDSKVEEAPCGTKEECKAWIDEKLAGEGGEGASVPAGGVQESISRRFITESKSGGVKLKTFSQILSETRIPGLTKNLVATKKVAPKKR